MKPFASARTPACLRFLRFFFSGTRAVNEAMLHLAVFVLPPDHEGPNLFSQLSYDDVDDDDDTDWRWVWS